MKLVKLLGAIVVIAIIIAGLLYYFKGYFIPSTVEYSDTYTAYDALRATDPDFALGESLLAEGNLAGAQDAFDKALPLASDDFQRGVIMYDLALIQMSTDPVDSISFFQVIATNPNYAYATRAYALQNIGLIEYNAQYGGEPSTTVQKIVSTTFEDGGPAFSSMLTNSDVSLAYRHLYDAADALYPLPIPEAMSAEWYANQMLGAGIASSASAAYDTQINANLVLVDSTIQSLAGDHSLDGFAALALVTKADVLRKLSYLGYSTPADVETAYQQSIAAYDLSTVPAFSDGFARYDYTVYLSSLSGTTTVSQVSSVLSPIYSNTAYATGPLGAFLKSLATSTSSLHADAVLVGQADPQFRQYLLSLGWQQTSFN